MAGEPSRLRREAVLLRDDSMGVATEDKPRKIQKRERHNNGYYCSLKGEWLAQLNLDEQSEATLHSMSMGVKPVIVQNPAIIIQPKGVLEYE